MAQPRFKITLVGADGKARGDIMLPSPRREKDRELDHTQWDRVKSIRRFCWYLSRHDSEGLEAALNALVRLDCLDQALEHCLKGSRPNLKKVKTLLSLWNKRGIWSIPRALKGELYLFTDAVRYFAPPYTGEALTLYRGQERDEPFGIAWTSKYEMAAGQFSAGRTEPVVLSVCASPEMVIVHVPDHISTPKTNPANSHEYEDEYLLDPRPLVGRASVVGRCVLDVI